MKAGHGFGYYLSMDKEATARDLLGYLTSSLVGKGVDLNGATSLFEARLLDSVRLMELIDHVEKRYGVRVSPMDIVLENFDTVDRMIGYLERKAANYNSM